MDVGVFANSQFGQVLHLVDLPCKIFIYLFLGFVELLIVFLLPTLQKRAFLILDLPSGTVNDSSQVLNELLIVAEIIF
jgi:hypothetical protein